VRHIILKPPASARGTGISIISKYSEVPTKTPLIAQHYIESPLTINNSKFDLRIYVYVPSLDPLRVYVYDEGLVRFASVAYEPSSHASYSNQVIQNKMNTQLQSIVIILFHFNPVLLIFEFNKNTGNYFLTNDFIYQFMHLTNYSINKAYSVNAKEGETAKSAQAMKWKLSEFWTYLRELGHDADALKVLANLDRGA
jgi:tubulin polyglutamylase TTLL4